jgi:hypothetical protein
VKISNESALNYINWTTNFKKILIKFIFSKVKTQKGKKKVRIRIWPLYQGGMRRCKSTVTQGREEGRGLIK